MSVKCFGLLPLRWTSVCSARELEGSSSSASGREAGRAHRDMRLERNRDLNSKVGEQLLPKRESCSVGKEWSLWLCSCTCSLCSPGWEHGRFLLPQSPWTSCMGVSTWVLPELSSPLGRHGGSRWAALGVPTYSWQPQLVAPPLAPLPGSCLAVLEPPQLRQPLHPSSVAARLNPVCGNPWEHWGCDLVLPKEVLSSASARLCGCCDPSTGTSVSLGISATSVASQEPSGTE